MDLASLGLTVDNAGALRALEQFENKALKAAQVAESASERTRLAYKKWGEAQAAHSRSPTNETASAAESARLAWIKASRAAEAASERQGAAQERVRNRQARLDDIARRNAQRAEQQRIRAHVRYWNSAYRETDQATRNATAQQTNYWTAHYRHVERESKKAVAAQTAYWRQYYRALETQQRKMSRLHSQALAMDSRRTRTAARQYARDWSAAHAENERRTRRAAQAHQNAMRQMERAARNAARGQSDSFRMSTDGIVRGLGLITAGVGVAQLTEYADTWMLINARTRLTTTSMEQAKYVQDRLFESSNNNRTSLEATETLYFRVARAGHSLGRSLNEIITFTDLVNKSLIIGGATIQEATQSTIQLSQALASGRLQGDEFRSIMESMPAVAQALAKHFHATGKTADATIGQLYKLREEGKITSQDIIAAVLAQQKVIEAEFKTIPVTIGQAYQVFKNHLTKLIGETGQTSGAIQAVTKSLVWLGENIKTVANVIGLALVYWASWVAVTKTYNTVAAIQLGLTALKTKAIAAEAAAAAKATGSTTTLAGASGAAAATTTALAGGASAAAAGVSRLTVATTALRTVLLGPLGIALAIGTVIGLLVSYKSAAEKAAASTDQFKASLMTLTNQELISKESEINEEFYRTQREAAEMVREGRHETIPGVENREGRRMRERLESLRQQRNAIIEHRRMMKEMDTPFGVVPADTDKDKYAERRARFILDFENDLKELIAVEQRASAVIGMQGMELARVNAEHQTAQELLKKRHTLDEALSAKTIRQADHTRLLALAESTYNDLLRDRIELMQAVAIHKLEKEGNDEQIKLRNQIALAGRYGLAQEQMKIKQDAINARHQATLDYEGEAYAIAIKQINAAEELQQQLAIVEHFANDIAEAFNEAFVDIFSGNIEGFRDFFNTIKNMFFKMMAEMATDRVMRTIGPKVFEALGQVFAVGSVGSAPSAATAGGAAQRTVGTGAGTKQSPIALETVTATAQAQMQASGNEMAKKIAKHMATAIMAYSISNTVGYASGSKAGGVIGGIASGAATGFAMGGPLGAKIGAAVGAIGGLVGAMKRQREVARMRAEVTRSNTAALERLRNKIDGSELMSGRNLSKLMPFAGLLPVLSSGINMYTDRGVRDYKALSGALKGDPTKGNLAELEKQYGVTFEQLGRAAQELGITLFDAEGRLVRSALVDLQKALELAVEAATTFGNNLDDIRMRQEAYRQLFDKDNPEQHLKDSYEILNSMAPELMKQLGLSNLNLDTEAGRNVLLEGLREIFMMIQSGKLTPELLGSFTDKGGLIDAILGAKKSLDGLGSAVDRVTTDFPKAMDLLFYEQKHGTAPWANPGTTAPGHQEPTGGGSFTGIAIHGDINITAAPGEDGEDFLYRFEAAVNERAARGGTTILPSTVLR